MSSVLIEAHFLPSLEYWCAVSPHNEIVIEKYEHFEKQSLRNRCFIVTTHGPARIGIPLTGKHGKTYIKDVRIDYTIRWVNNMWRTLTSAYMKSPYFEHYADDLHEILFSKEKFLLDLNLRLLSLCLKWIGWNKIVSTSTGYVDFPEDGCKDLRNVISAKSGCESRPFYHPFPYQQVFGNNFAANMSVIDLVFCAGPQSGAILKKAGAA